jgi:hypothetical protein
VRYLGKIYSIPLMKEKNILHVIAVMSVETLSREKSSLKIEKSYFA